MNSFITTTTLLLLLLHLPLPSSATNIATEFLYPNFTTSSYQFIDRTGAFLSSLNSNFTAAITNPNPTAQTDHFYFCVLHVASKQIIWTANRNSPISNSDEFSLTTNGISILQENGQPIWSTSGLNSSVRALQLLESGNLVLLDNQNRSIWQSFDQPTDTIVVGQKFPVGALLSTNASGGNYEFTVVDRDATLQWNGLTYWKLSMEVLAVQISNSPVAYMMINGTGLYLVSAYRDAVVYQVVINTNSPGFRIAQLSSDGRFYVKSFVNGQWNQEFAVPGGDCRIPDFCGGYGLCTVASSGSNGSVCSCPLGFHNVNPKGCLPTNADSPPLNCSNGSELGSTRTTSYVELSAGIDYFSNDFSAPTTVGGDILTCGNLCSENCSCFGYFYEEPSSSCFLLVNKLGSFFTATSEAGRLGYIKTIVSSNTNTNVLPKRRKTTPAAVVLIPSIAACLLVGLLVVGFLTWRKSRLSKTKEVQLGRRLSNNTLADYDAFSIPGLPVRFDYEELDVATDNFRNKIGSGGFGDVYKGTLSDKTVVAVKKITNSTNQGKKDFCTEIAIIGNIHHVNLVKLKGFCAQGRERLLVYEYMSLGSLDRPLFGLGPVLEWQERFDIAIGTARALAYLHGGCEHKIIHCDIKPENILLNEHLQVKISDFGLSKLLSPEQSSHFTTMRGTRGYLAPEWLTSSAISDKTDVYSYGMVLLEIVSGRKNCSTKTQTHSVDSGSGGGSTLSTVSIHDYFPLFALEMHEQRRYTELADPKLEGRVMSEELEMLVRVALCCVHEDPMLRPSMAIVVSMLEGGIPLGEPRLDGLNFLRFYGRRVTEASTTEAPYMMFPNAQASLSSTTSGSRNSLSYMSSQQISGPR